MQFPYKTLAPLLPRRYNFGKRRDTLREALRLLGERDAETLLNTSSDVDSTLVFGVWAKQNNGHLYSVDMDPSATERAGETVSEMDLSENVTLVTSDSVAYLDDFTDTVDFLYLDNTAGQDHHLKEIEALEGCLHDDTVILINDYDKLVIEGLTAQGWKVHMSESQVILLNE